MNLILASTGSYPRIGDSAELQVLRRTIAAADRGECTPAELAEAEQEMTRRAIAEQLEAGLELLTDGQIRWYDPISHLAGKLAGVKIDGLLRFFDTNFYFRQPVLTARPQRTRPLLTLEYRFASDALAALVAARPTDGTPAMKAVLTGPYTLAKFSLVETDAMGALETRALAYAEALAAEGLAEGRAVIVDATNLTRRDRRRFLRLGERAGGVVAVRVTAPEEVVRRRLSRPREGFSQAGVEVFERMAGRAEPLEVPAVVVDTRFDLEPTVALIARLAERLR